MSRMVLGGQTGMEWVCWRGVYGGLGKNGSALD